MRVRIGVRLRSEQWWWWSGVGKEGRKGGGNQRAGRGLICREGKGSEGWTGWKAVDSRLGAYRRAGRKGVRYGEVCVRTRVRSKCTAFRGYRAGQDQVADDPMQRRHRVVSFPRAGVSRGAPHVHVAPQCTVRCISELSSGPLPPLFTLAPRQGGGSRRSVFARADARGTP